MAIHAYSDAAKGRSMGTFTGRQPLHVFKLLQERRALLASGKRWAGDRKLGLVVEGGSMRGVISCGYLAALEDHGFSNCFDVIYGTSSGALNSVYFVSNSSMTAMSIYYENATSSQCTNPWKFPNVLNVDWLVDNWIMGKKRFDIEGVLTRLTPIKIALTNRLTGLTKFLCTRDMTRDELNAALKATAYTPLLTTGHQVIRGESFLDGMVGAAIPFEEAESDGCTDVVCLLTREAGYRKKSRRWIVALEALRLFRHSSLFTSAYHRRSDHYNRVLDRLFRKETVANTLIISPTDRTQTLSNLETRPHVVRAAGENARESASDLLTRASEEGSGEKEKADRQCAAQDG